MDRRRGQTIPEPSSLRFADVPDDAPSELGARLRRLEDRAEIADLMNRYAEAVRLGSAATMSECFSDDASIDYGEGSLVCGREQILGYFAAMLAAAAPAALDERLASTPFVSNVAIELDGDDARCESTVLAIHAGLRGGRGVVVVRGTRNDDALVRTSAGWRIRHRVHSTAWQFEVPGTTGNG
jgi:hypothetical protein